MPTGRMCLILVLCCAVLMLPLAACGGRAAPTPAPTLDPGYVPTSVAQSLAAAATYRASLVTPTATAMPLPTATATALPTDTPTPALAPTPVPPPGGVVNADALNVRTGPGTVYGIVGVLKAGDEVEISARTAAGDWLAVVTAEGRQGWVYATYVDLSGPLDSIPVAAEIPPTPRPAATATATPE